MPARSDARPLREEPRAKDERQQPQHIRVFLSSPGDVAEERELARRLLKDELPVDPFLRDRFTFDVVSWDDPAALNPMPATITPQEAVNRFGPKPSECDVVVVVLWSRLGTHLGLEAFRKPDGTPYLSGTEWELEDAWSAWKARKRPEILVYRRTEEPAAKLGAPDWQDRRRQYERVGQFFSRFANPDGSLRGGWTGYGTPAQFRERLAGDLRRLLRERLETTRVAAEKGVPAALLRAVLARHGQQADLPEQEISAQLVRWAEELASVREQLQRLANSRPEAEITRHRTTALLEAGDLDGAKHEMAEAAGPAVSATGGLAAGRDLRVGRDATINQNRIPKGSIALAALGLLLLGYALVTGGSRITAQNSNVNTGTMSNSRMEVNPSGPAGGPSR